MRHTVNNKVKGIVMRLRKMIKIIKGKNEAKTQ